VTAFRNRLQQEAKRFNNTKLLSRNQNVLASREWKVESSFFTGERGTWMDRYDVHECRDWT